MFSTSQAISFNFYNAGNMCFTIYFKHFVFIELFDLNSNLDRLFERSSIKDFLVDSSVNFLVDLLIGLCISFIALKLLKIFSSGLIPINSQLSYFSIAFCLFIS